MRWCWIDRFIEFQSGRYAKAIKTVSLVEEHLRDHFPEYPIMPHALVLEGLAQTGGLLVSEANDFSEKVILAKVPKAEFHFEALPGDVLTYQATLEDIQERGARVSTTSHRRDALQAEVDIVFVHLSVGDQGDYSLAPEAFLRMAHTLGMFEVGRAADGSHLTAPALPGRQS
jgi:3-hydroxyacyl-[acyl-carrier-protein] dehydratase